ncbi:MAG TPA: polysaccharide deacetylase family protein [Burkholderiales bacterium]|nr:polysaccharide deacetylase family protein [Burkholderiales bacterium]
MKPRTYGPFPYVPLPERPRLVWPNGARVALWIAPNLEFFGLDSNLPGPGNERLPDEKAWRPAVRSWAVRDYGNRIGVWRIFDVMAKHGVRGTAPLNSSLCAQHPQIIRRAMELGWEFMGHNRTNSIRCVDVAPEREADEIRVTLDEIAAATGHRPVGWLGAGTAETWNTLDHLIAENCRYVGDWTNDEQPYVMTIDGKTIVSLPYTSDINDVTCYFHHKMQPEQWEAAVKRHFDVLYREGGDHGRVLCLPIHPFVTGTPQRIDAFDAALAHILSHDGVWAATGSEIVSYYLESGAAI